MSARVKHNLIIEIIIRIVLWLLFVYCQYTDPFIRIIKPEEMWLYKYPLSKAFVPASLLWSVVILIPAIVITVDYLLKRNSRDTKEAILCITLIYALNGFLTSYLKVLIGRPRPDFYARCLPDGIENEQLKCTGDKILVMEGRKSFPSGHSSFSFCSMVFLSMYLAGKLQVYNQNGKTESWKFLICILPILLAVSIAISRTCDYRHHWQDIAVGGMLGTLLAYGSYKLYFPSLSSNNSHLSYAAQNLGIEN